MDPRIVCSVVIFAILAIVQSHVLRQMSMTGHNCSVDADCGATACCAYIPHKGGHYCEAYRTAGQGCHRPNNTHLMIYRCGCSRGLMCEHIQLDPGHHLGHDDILHTVENQLEHTGLGICQ